MFFVQSLKFNDKEAKGLTFVYFYGIIYVGIKQRVKSISNHLFQKIKIKKVMYYPYYPLKKEEIILKLEEQAISKKAAIEILRIFSGFMAAFLVIILCAFCLRFIEIEITRSVSDAAAASIIEKVINRKEECSVREILESGYLKVTKIFNNNFESGNAKDFFHKIFGIQTAYAAAPYQAMKLVQSAENLEMTASERQLFIVGFKNTGSKIWKNDGNAFISIYTYSPKYRKSKFQDESWYDAIQPAKLKNEIIKPGEIGYVEFFLKAPDEPGEYTETFRMAAENIAWMTGGEFSIKIKVFEKPELKAARLLQSHREITLKQGEVVNFKVGFKNVGSIPWSERIIARSDLQMASIGATSDAGLFRDSSWVDSLKPIVIDDEIINPGQLGFLDFNIKAPQQAGQFVLRFSLVANGEYVEGGELEIPVTVTNESVLNSSSGIAEIIPTMPLGPEPNIRVGLYYTTEAESGPIYVVTGGDYEVRDASLNLLTNLPPRVRATLNYDFSSGVYSIELAGATFTSQEHLRILPLLPSTFEITNFENRPSWNRSLNDNVFRGTMEFRFSDETDRLWVINDLPMEDYLKGLAESMSTDPMEYQKALVIAARTYAYYHFANGGKHPKQNLTLNASAYDQVYKGYNSELRLPNVVQAVNETRGMTITYGGKVVVTPYFAKSNGQTKTWTQAWGGESKPWLPSKPCPYDAAKGRTLLGHGVGMSMYDARDRAKDGFNFQEILNAYYTNIQVAKIYN